MRKYQRSLIFTLIMAIILSSFYFPPQTKYYAAGNGTGLVGMYFNNSDFTNNILTRTDTTINFDWGVGSPNAAIDVDSYSIRWVGKVQPVYTQSYTFYTNSDDGVRLWINNQLIIDNWTDHAITQNTGTISLVAGIKYDVKLEYYDNVGGAVCKLEWSSSSQARQVIPQSQLYSPGLDITNMSNLVGICYSLWFNPVVNGSQIYDNTEIIKQAGISKTAPQWGGYGAFHFWSKPAVGYYNSSNPTVIRTHMQQLAAAGVDFIILDNTNSASTMDQTYYNSLFRDAAQVLLDTVKQMRSEGAVTPYIVFWTGSNSTDPDPAYTGRDIYNRFYASGNYSDLYVYYNGKPFLNTTDLIPAELTNKYTVRKMWGLQSSLAEGEWSFMTAYPQPVSVTGGVNEQISVSVAHQSSYMSDMFTATSRRGGSNFAKQWSRAFAVRPKIVTITWWNEWIAQNFITDGNPVFVDNYTMENSRDIEPVTGGHGSTYYNWMKYYIQEYKANKTVPKGNVDTADLGDFETVTQGWKSGSNVTASNYVFSQAQAYIPQSSNGYCLFEAQMGTQVAGNVTQYITRDYGPNDQLLDLSEFTDLKYTAGGWGGAPGATAYQSTIRITGTGGNQITKTVNLANPSVMQEVSIDIRSWPYRDAISKIEIGYTAVGCTVAWGGRFYVDYVRASTTGYNLGDFEFNTEGWLPEQNIAGVSSVQSASGTGIATSNNGSKVLQADMALTLGQNEKWIKKDFSSSMNFSQFKYMKFAFSAWKGAPEATSYKMYVRLTSNSGQTLNQEYTFTGDYTPMVEYSLDISNWAYRNEVKKIQIGYAAIGGNQNWSGKLFIDNIRMTK